MTNDTCPTSATILDWVFDPSNMRAWEIFATRYRVMLMEWCLRHHLQESEAEDVTQQILLSMREKIPSYVREKGRFRSWLKTVTYHECMSFLRKTRPRQLQHLVDDLTARDDLEKAFDEQTEIELLQTAFTLVEASVSARDFGIFMDLAIRGRKAAEIAHELGMTVGAVQMVKFRVKNEVKLKVLELDATDLPP